MENETAGMKSFRVDFRRHLVLTFIASKGGALPKSLDELAGWMLEFYEHAFRMIDHLQEAYQEHLMTCVRPIVIRKGE